MNILIAALVFCLAVEVTNITITSKADSNKWANRWLQQSSKEK